MKLKPAHPALLVKNPKNGKPLPAEGAEVGEIGTYWQRRLESGDVVEVVEAPAKVAAEAVKVSEKKKETK